MKSSKRRLDDEPPGAEIGGIEDRVRERYIENVLRLFELRKKKPVSNDA